MPKVWEGLAWLDQCEAKIKAGQWVQPHTTQLELVVQPALAPKPIIIAKTANSISMDDIDKVMESLKGLKL